VWDAVLEYRVWYHPHDGAEGPLTLILQREYIDAPKPGKYLHIESERITELPPEFLTRPQRNENTIPNFMALGASENKLDIIRSAVKG
jgi:hypothetical protein